MASPFQRGGFDQLDEAILRELQVNGRVSVADLARKIHLSPPAVHQRIKRMERAGVIRQYVALVDRGVVGADVLAFVRLSFQPHNKATLDAFHARLNDWPEVLECYHTAGAFDLLLKIVVRDHRALDAFLQTHLMTQPGVDRVETTLALSELKSTTVVELK